MTAILPVNITFKNWANELRNSFPDQDIPQVSSENGWESFQNMLSSNRCFEGSNLPLAVGFANWQGWASEFLLSIGA